MQQEQAKPQIVEDPSLAIERQRAEKNLLDGLQTQALGDTASLMTRYGTRLALANGGISPTATPSFLRPA